MKTEILRLLRRACHLKKEDPETRKSVVAYIADLLQTLYYDSPNSVTNYFSLLHIIDFVYRELGHDN